MGSGKLSLKINSFLVDKNIPEKWNKPISKDEVISGNALKSSILNQVISQDNYSKSSKWDYYFTNVNYCNNIN